MKMKFSKFERVAGVFVLTCTASAIFVVGSLAIKRGWFEEEISLRTSFTQGDGLFPGTPVQMSGLRAGAVDDVVLNKENKVEVKFHVSRRFFEKIKSDSRVSSIRPFVIGDKALDISLGSDDGVPVAANSEVNSVDSIDLIDLLSGRRMSSMLTSLNAMSENLRIVMDAFKDSTRTRGMIRMFDQVAPLITDMRSMAHEMSAVGSDLNHDHRLRQTLEHVQKVTEDVAQITPELVKMIQDTPDAGKHMSLILTHMSALTEAMVKIIPALSEVAPDLPRASHRAIEAMDEAVVTLKAMQKSFLLSGKVEDVRKEENARQNENKKNEGRVPATVNP